METDPESAESFELYTRSGDQYAPTGIHACASCRGVATTKAQADLCCRPRLCSCGAALNNAFLKCFDCRMREQDEREARKWEEAPKVHVRDLGEDDLPASSLSLYSARLDEFFSEKDLLVEEHVERGLPVDRVYLCVDDPGQRPDAVDIIESCCADMFEDAAEHISSAEGERLQAFLDEWWAKNRPPGVVPGPRGVIIPVEDAVAHEENSRA